MAKDPVCHMEVNEKTAAATSAYKDKTYYFCAPGCKKAFDADPEKYLHCESELISVPWLQLLIEGGLY
jgi:YHS domain-containing protein